MALVSAKEMLEKAMDGNLGIHSVELWESTLIIRLVFNQIVHSFLKVALLPGSGSRL